MSLFCANNACVNCRFHHYDCGTGDEWCEKEEDLTDSEYEAYTEGGLDACSVHEEDVDYSYPDFPYIDVEDVEEDYL